MFGIGPQELMLIGVLILIIFGPMKAAGMARKLGHFVKEANHTVEDFKEELLSEEEDKEARRTVEGFKEEPRSSGEEARTSSPSASVPRFDDEDDDPADPRDQKEDYKPG